MEFEPVIGLEVHAQLKTKTKIFCNCSATFGAPPNTHTCPVCLGMPGVLPVLNKKVVEYSIRMAIATNCTIARTNIFARKNYFYPDLPKGYQISQYESPIAEHGYINIETKNNEKKQIGITRIHMEEDAGKSTHDQTRPVSMVDLNRTGVPLIEIVSEPDIRSPEEAVAYLKQLRSIVRYIDICDGNMEEGSFRCDANISIRPKGQSAFGTRAEIKNINSFKFVEKAIQYEINRQKDIIENKGQVVQETRLWDTSKNRTISMRGKEDAHDYRYFPEPDLMPIEIKEEWIDEIKKEIPELPDKKKQRFINDYQIPEYDASVLTSNIELAKYFENCTKKLKTPKLASNWIMGPLLGLLNTSNKTIEDSPISAENLTNLLELIEKETISSKIAKKVFDEMAVSKKTADQIVKEQGLVQVTDESTIEKIIDEIIASAPKEVEAYKGGKKKLMGFFVGQAMKKTKGRANPKIVNKILNSKLK